MPHLGSWVWDFIAVGDIVRRKALTIDKMVMSRGLKEQGAKVIDCMKLIIFDLEKPKRTTNIRDDMDLKSPHIWRNVWENIKMCLHGVQGKCWK